jgi:hypothetical protein
MSRLGGAFVNGDDQNKSLHRVLSLVESQLSHNDNTVRITPVKRLVGVTKTYRCNIEKRTPLNISNNSIVIKYNPKNQRTPLRVSYAT